MNWRDSLKRIEEDKAGPEDSVGELLFIIAQQNREILDKRPAFIVTVNGDLADEDFQRLRKEFRQWQNQPSRPLMVSGMEVREVS